MDKVVLTPLERRLFSIMPLVVFVMFVVMVGLSILVQRNNENVEDLSNSTTRVERSTDHLENFVGDLEEEDPSEAARNAAITEAVNEVPRIKQILCEAFPGASACQEPE